MVFPVHVGMICGGKMIKKQKNSVPRTRWDDLLFIIYPMCPVSVEEARELSWRKFYYEAGDQKELERIDGTIKLKKLLNTSEKCFEDILKNTITNKELNVLIGLPSTEIWKNKHKNRKIKILNKKDTNNAKKKII